MENEVERSLQCGQGDGGIRPEGKQKISLRTTIYSDLVVQRSRAYVGSSQLQQGVNPAIFPVRRVPS